MCTIMIKLGINQQSHYQNSQTHEQQNKSHNCEEFNCHRNRIA